MYKIFYSVPLLRQTWVTFSVLMFMVGQGMVIGYTTMLAALQKPISGILLDNYGAFQLETWLERSCFIGLVISSILMDWCGRKTTYLLMILTGVTGWLLIDFAQTLSMLIVGCLLSGTTFGNLLLTSLIISEYASPKYRGIFLCLKTVSVSVGITISHILGNDFDCRLLSTLVLIFYIVSFGMACDWPESPVWLASRKQFVKCEESFIWLRGTEEPSMAEFQELIKAHKEQYMYKCLRTRTKIVEFMQKFIKTDFLKPITIMIFAFLLLEASGKHYFPAYTLQFIGEITPRSFYNTLYIDLVLLTSSTISCISIRLFKRRSVLLSTGIAAVIVLILTSSHIFLISNNILPNRPSISILLLFLYLALANLGCTTLPLIFIGEILPTLHRAVGSAVSGVIISILYWVALKAIPYLLECTKVYGVFAILGLLITVSVLILYFILPETKDRTLEEIDYYIYNGCFRNEESIDDIFNI
ncbi:facilitated trehalose transporter Tret1-like [Galleria mellonella]|uniref:Facilitated trehalose transporter Tret1-like n=1 Tax=Galleria mellonella TaxID=7137 RepID=A0A6J1WPX1_GALME|nr:facilitated trehalose transporter Tret1-like [Galleria mellonella]